MRRHMHSLLPSLIKVSSRVLLASGAFPPFPFWHRSKANWPGREYLTSLTTTTRRRRRRPHLSRVRGSPSRRLPRHFSLYAIPGMGKFLKWPPVHQSSNMEDLALGTGPCYRSSLCVGHKMRTSSSLLVLKSRSGVDCRYCNAGPPHPCGISNLTPIPVYSVLLDKRYFSCQWNMKTFSNPDRSVSKCATQSGRLAQEYASRLQAK